MGKVPYPYQLDAVKAATDTDQGIIRIATGGGKTIISALITAQIGKRTVIYVIGKDLLHQIHNLYEELFPDVRVGKIGDGICEIEDINIASVWSVGQALGIKRAADRDNEKKVEPEKYGQIRKMLVDCKTHIFDECHVAACDTIQEIGRNVAPENIYGMSASPWRDDNADLLIECVLGKRIVDLSASYLIERDYLVKPIIKFKKVPRYPEKLPRNYNTIYKNYIVENDVRNNLVSDNAEHLVNLGYQTLVLYQSVNHGKILHKLIADKLPCVLLSGKDKSKVRREAKEKLEAKEINCIIASKIFDIGIDLPSLSGLVVAGSGKSSVRALQRIGRVIRKYPGKKQAAIIDFADNAAYLRKHAEERHRIYSIEDAFEVSWPTAK
jgi:superfamily II DNA or RNA helicase